MKRVTALLLIVFAIALTACAPASTPAVATATSAPPPSAVPASPTALPPTAVPPSPTVAAPSETPLPGQPTNTAVPPTAYTEPTYAPPTATATSAPVFASMTYRDFEIAPLAITIKVGTTVIFRIESASGAFHQPYSATFQNHDPNDFESPTNLGNGSQFSFTFKQAGAVQILCGYHGNMTATITINP